MRTLRTTRNPPHIAFQFLASARDRERARSAHARACLKPWDRMTMAQAACPVPGICRNTITTTCSGTAPPPRAGERGLLHLPGYPRPSGPGGLSTCHPRLGFNPASRHFDGRRQPALFGIAPARRYIGGRACIGGTCGRTEIPLRGAVARGAPVLAGYRPFPRRISRPVARFTATRSRLFLSAPSTAMNSTEIRPGATVTLA